MGAVVSILNWNGPGLTEEEVMLGTPDNTEARSLPHHVERCAMRYRLFTKRQASQGRDIAQTKWLTVGLLGAVLITSPQVRAIFEWVAKVV